MALPAHPTRGILHPARLPTFTRLPPPAGVADLVRWCWVPEWDVDPGRTSRQHVVGYPSCNLVVDSREGGFAGFAGPTTRASHQDLTGRGWAVGALLQPAAVPAFSADPAADRDRYRRLDEPVLVREVTAAMTSTAPGRLERAAGVLARFVADRVGPVEGDALTANAFVALVEADPALVRLEDVAARLAVSPRTLQRLAQRFVGLPPAVAGGGRTRPDRPRRGPGADRRRPRVRRPRAPDAGVRPRPRHLTQRVPWRDSPEPWTTTPPGAPVTELDPGAAAIVTGAAGGIGTAVVAALAARGVHVACLDREGADFGPVLGICADAGVRALGIGVDVRDRGAVLAAGTEASTLGRVRYGVNCAGVDDLRPSTQTPEEGWRRVLDVNLTGVMNSCLAEHEAMAGAGGSIVNVASVSATVFNRGAVAHSGYSASKAGVVGLSRVLAVEWVPQRIRVNSISPGYTRTEMTDANPPEQNAHLADQVPMGRMASVQEVAAPVLFLLSDDAAYVTGHDLRVDGGLTAW